jgi:NAD(P)-dependent dehydrogenase (short-subunit alcohol dehydrogenase family)
MELKGTVAIVTGGGTGIGQAVCRRLAEAGARAIVVNYSRSQKDADATAAEIVEAGSEGLAIKADVASEPDVKRMVAETVERFGRLDVLINNAGTTRFIAHPDIDALTDEVWDTLFAVNLKGTFYCSRAAAEHLRRTKGAIVNIASIAGMRGAGSSIAYGVTKAGILQLTRGLAVALAPHVRVNAVAPGLVATRWFRVPFGEEAAQSQEATVGAATPLNGVAVPDHVAQAVMGFLAADFVTGQALVVDGGKNVTY